jgi:hypothetical protein
MQPLRMLHKRSAVTCYTALAAAGNYKPLVATSPKRPKSAASSNIWGRKCTGQSRGQFAQLARWSRIVAPGLHPIRDFRIRLGGIDGVAVDILGAAVCVPVPSVVESLAQPVPDILFEDIADSGSDPFGWGFELG